MASPKPVRGVVRGDFTAATQIVWHEILSADVIPAATMDTYTVNIHSIHITSGAGTAEIQLFWGVAGDAGTDSHIIECAASAMEIDKEFVSPNLTPTIPKGFAGGATANGCFVIGPGIGSCCVIYAEAR